MAEREFEEYDPTTRQEKRKKIKKKKTWRRIVIFLLVFAVVFFVYENRNLLTPDNLIEGLKFSLAGNKGGNGFPVKVAGNSISSIQSMGEAALLSDTSFIVLNGKGGEIINRQHGYAQPKMKVTPNRAMIYDMGGKHFKVESKTKTLVEKTMDQNIITAAISVNGTYGVATSSKGYLAEMTVYKPNGIEIFKWYSSEYYIVDMAINYSGKGATVAAVTTKDGDICSVLITFDFRKKEPKAKIELDQTLLLSVDYLQNGNIAAVGDNKTCVVREDGRQKTEYSFESRSLAAYKVASEGGIALALSDYSDRRKCIAVMVDASGRKKGELQTEVDVRNIDFDGKKALYLSNNRILELNTSAKQLKSFASSADVSAVLLCKNKILAVGMNEIRQVQ